MSSEVLTRATVECPEAPAGSPPLTPSSLPRLVRQRTALDCGVAAAAMLAQVSYARAARVHPPERPGGGLQAMDVAVMLRRLTGRLVRLSGAAEGCALHEWSAPAPAIVLIHEPDSLRGHYVVVTDAHVLDPELEAVVPLAAYRHRDWRIFRVLTLEEEALEAPVAA